MTGSEVKGLTLKTPEALLSPWSSGEPSLNGFNTPWPNIRWHSSFASSSADPPSWFMHSLSNRVRPENRREMKCRNEAGLRNPELHFQCGERCSDIHCTSWFRTAIFFLYHKELNGDVSVSDVIIKHLHLQAIFTPFTCGWQERWC